MAAQANQGCGTIVAVLVAVVLFGSVVSQCSKSGSQAPAKPFGVASLSNQIDAMETPSAIQPLSSPGIDRGLGHLRSVVHAERLSGAMIYSQNCYDRLSRQFSWEQLDSCGGFDLLAVRAADNADMSGLSNESEYFGPEAAAARYLAVATKAGEEAGDADLRFADLQKRVGKARLPTPAKAAATASEPEGADAMVSNDGVEAWNIEAVTGE